MNLYAKMSAQAGRGRGKGKKESTHERFHLLHASPPTHQQSVQKKKKTTEKTRSSNKQNSHRQVFILKRKSVWCVCVCVESQWATHAHEKHHPLTPGSVNEREREFFCVCVSDSGFSCSKTWTPHPTPPPQNTLLSLSHTLCLLASDV